MPGKDQTTQIESIASPMSKTNSLRILIILTSLILLIFLARRLINEIITFPYIFDWTGIIKIYIWSILLFILPGFVIISAACKNKFDFIERLILAFVSGITLATINGLIQKYSGMDYSKGYILLSFGCVYFLTYLILNRFNLKPLLQVIKPSSRRFNINTFLDYSILMLSILLVMDFILRTRSSSLSLSGDQEYHFFMTLESLLDGPFYDKLFCYSQFFPNWYTCGFNNILAVLKTVTDLPLMDLFRYFPLLIGCLWILSIYILVKHVINSRRYAAITVFFAFGVSGGLNESQIPFIAFTSPWALGWILFAALLLLFLVGIKSSQTRYGFFIGLLFGATLLIQPLLLWRLLPIAIPFLIILSFQKDKVKLELKLLGIIILVSAIVVGTWALPLYIKYGFWNKNSLAEIIRTYGQNYPREIEWIKHRLLFSPSIKEFFRIIVVNIGYFATFLSVIGIISFFREKKTNEKILVIIWFVALFFAALFGLTSRPTRLFEYLFFSMIILSGIGLKYSFEIISPIKNDMITKTGLVLVILLLHFNHFYLPKYSFTVANVHSKKVFTAEESKKHSDYLTRLYSHLKNSDNGLTEYFGKAPNYLITLNPDFWEIYVKIKKKQGVPPR